MSDQPGYLYIEMWNAKPDWLGLSAQERGDFMGNVDKWLGTEMGPGCSVHACCVNDGDTTPRVPFTYVVVWSLSDKSHVKSIADGTSKVGWYKYFDQYNIGGTSMSSDALVEAIMGL